MRRLAHEPLGWRPTTLLVTVLRYRCSGCGHVWRQDTSRAAEPRAKLTRGTLGWALQAIVCQHLTVARVAEGRTLHTGNDLLTARQHARLNALFADDEHVQVEASWRIYQQMISAYRHPDRARGRSLMSTLIDALSRGVPEALTELVTLGRTLKRRAADVLAYFDRPGTSNGLSSAM